MTVAADRAPRFAPPDILWYFGGIVAAVAGASLVATASGAHRGAWTFLTGVAVMAFVGALSALLLLHGRRIAGGVLAAAFVWIAPATLTGLVRLLGGHPRLLSGTARISVPGTGVTAKVPPHGFHESLFAIAIGTIAIGLAVYWLVRFTFVLLPVVVWLAVAAFLLVPAVAPRQTLGVYGAETVATGVALSVVGLLLDARLRRREAFWWYVVGLFEIAAALAYYIARYQDEWLWLLLLVVSAAVLLASAPASRAVWTVYSMLGVLAALGHYAAGATAAWRTTLVLVFVGLVLVLAGFALDVDVPLVRRLSRRRTLDW